MSILIYSKASCHNCDAAVQPAQHRHISYVCPQCYWSLDEQPAQQQEPVFWYRPCSNGMYEGPIHNAQIERVRKDSGSWHPLYTSPQPAQQEPEAKPNEKALQAMRGLMGAVNAYEKATKIGGWYAEEVQTWVNSLATHLGIRTQFGIGAENPVSEQPAQHEPVAWRDHVEQRLLTWRQSFVNKSGDQLALDDFMDKQSLDDLIDFVCDEYTSPPASKPPNIAAEAAEFGEWFDAMWAGDTADGQDIPTQGHADYDLYMSERTVAFGAWMAAKKAAHGIKEDA